MRASTQKRRAVFFTLLLSLVASAISVSTPAQAAPVPVLKTVVPIPANAQPPLSVTFEGLASTCISPCTAHFDYGDGNTEDLKPGEALIAGNDYVVGGNFTATMTLTDGTGKKASASLSFTITRGQTLASYLNDCEQKLGFQDSNVPSNLSCNNAALFAPNSIEGNTGPTGAVNDALGYARITDNVDLAFACRWLTNDTISATDPTVGFVAPFVKAQSVEMIIHNRQSGDTCFFEAAPQVITTSNGGTVSEVPATLVSPAVAARAAPNTPESRFWYEPLGLDNTLQCVDCHIAGPYISTPRVAPALAQFGLLNNGHDTVGRYKDENNKVVGRYHAVGTLAHFDDLALSNNNTSTCASGCHSIGDKGAVDDVFAAGNVLQLLPSITHVIDSLGNQRPSVSVTTSGAMKPYADNSHYRWINLDTPGDGVESENFASAKSVNAAVPVPELLKYCAAPTALEAHVVGIPVNLSTSTDQMRQFSDRLKTFNLKEGLVCINSDQENGQSCHDYAVHYLCSVNTATGAPTWSGWYNTDSPTEGGDHEERSRHQNICGGAAPIGIEAAMVTSGGGKAVYAMGPNDRLARFSPYGLTCNNSEQVDGKCSNYVVRYSACTDAPVAANRTLTNVYATGKQLTAASNSLVKGQAHNNSWDTQLWVVEPVANTEYVRLKNTSNGVTVYITVQSDGLTVGTAPFNNTATSEMWTVEPISGSTQSRLKNLSNGKYLTIQDPNSVGAALKDYLAIYAQALNTGWTSQRWIIQ